MSQDIPGKYAHKKSRTHYIELKPDGNYVLYEGATVVTGTYAVDGTELTIFGTDSTSRARIQDGVITDSEGDKWIRAKERVAAARGSIDDDPLPSMTWIPAIFRRDDFPWEVMDAVVILLIFVLLMTTK
jgi:hypothetical protein